MTTAMMSLGTQALSERGGGERKNLQKRRREGRNFDSSSCAHRLRCSANNNATLMADKSGGVAPCLVILRGGGFGSKFFDGEANAGTAGTLVPQCKKKRLLPLHHQDSAKECRAEGGRGRSTGAERTAEIFTWTFRIQYSVFTRIGRRCVEVLIVHSCSS